MAQEFDVVILGGGPGGYAAALYGAAAGLSIGMIEEARVGGTCLHRGCIPAKELLQTAEVVRTVAGAKEFGVEAGQPVLDLSVSQQRKQQVEKVRDREAADAQPLVRGERRPHLKLVDRQAHQQAGPELPCLGEIHDVPPMEHIEQAHDLLGWSESWEDHLSNK